MKEKLLEALRSKFPGKSATILSRIADKLAKTVTTEEQVKPAIEGVTTELVEVIESYGDSRATEASASAVANYESKHGLKDGKPADADDATKNKGEGGADTKDQKGKTDDSTPDWAKALIEQNRTLSERLNKMETERTSAGRKAKLEAIYGKLPQPLRKSYERIDVDTLTDEDFTKLSTEIASEVEEIGKTIKSKGAVFSTPSHSAGGAGEKELTKEQIEEINHRDGVRSSDGQPF